MENRKGAGAAGSRDVTERVARMKTDIQIAQEATLKPITEIAAGPCNAESGKSM